MKHCMLVPFCIGALLLLAVPLGAQDNVPEAVGMRPDAPAYALHGPYWVGVRDAINVETDDRPFSLTIWYPALNPDAVEEVTTYDLLLEDVFGPDFNQFAGRAIQDATPELDDGPYPLVLFSHGWGISWVISSYIPEHLASHGFVVMAVNHPGGSMRDQILLEEAIYDNWASGHVNWVLDSIRMIDYAHNLNESDDVLAGMINEEKVASVGYSFGGHVALQLAGAEYDFEGLKAQCAEIEGEKPEYCSLIDEEANLLDLAGLTMEVGRRWRVVDEPLVDAVVGLAPGYLPPFGPGGLATVDVPVLLINGTADTEVPTELHAGMAYNAISSDNRSLILFENASHFSFVDCGAWTEGAFSMCTDRVWDMPRVYDLVNHFTTAFLRDTLYGDVDAHNMLLSGAVQFPGIIYQTSLD